MARLVSAIPLIIYTSTSRPTVDLTVETDSGHFGRASLPLGYEDSLTRRDGLQIHQLVLEEIESLIPHILLGREVTDQQEFDRSVVAATQELRDKGLRAKVQYLISAACAKALCADRRMFFHEYLAEAARFDAYRGLPVPMITLISGGEVATTPFRVQAIMIAPTGIASLPDAVRAGSEISDALKLIFKAQGKFYAIGHEGGLSTRFDGNGTTNILCSVLETVVKAIEKADYKPGAEIQIAIDFAAKYCRNRNGHYNLVTKEEELSVVELVNLCDFISDRFPILMFEDPVDMADVDALRELHKRLEGKSLIAADDLLDDSTSETMYSHCDAVITKPDQLGTLSSTMKFVAAARDQGYIPVASHRSAETEDVLLSDLAAALSLPFVKAGGMSGSERTAKYNELLRISELYDNDRPVIQGCVGGR